MTSPLLSPIPHRAPVNTTMPPRRSEIRQRNQVSSITSNPPKPPVPPDPPPVVSLSPLPSQLHGSSLASASLSLLQASTNMVTFMSHFANRNHHQQLSNGQPQQYQYNDTPHILSRPLHLAPPDSSTTTSSAVHSNLREMSTSPSTTTVNHLLFISWFSPDVSSATVSSVSSCSNVSHRHKSETSFTAALPGYQIASPPASLAPYGNRANSDLVLGEWSQRICRFRCISSEYATSLRQQTLRHHSAVDISLIPARNNGCFPLQDSTVQHQKAAVNITVVDDQKPKETTSSSSWASTMDMGLMSLLGRMWTKCLQTFETIKPSILWPKKLNSSAYEVLKAAPKAASRFEFQHLTVYFDSQSLVSLLIFKGDVNELLSVVVDIRCLLQSFASIFTVFIPGLEFVVAASFAKSVLLSLSMDLCTT